MVEVLVATVILLLMVTLLGTITSHLGKMWTEINGQNERRTIARQVLQFMARDLQSAKLPIPTNSLVTTRTNATAQFFVSGSGNMQFLVVSGADFLSSSGTPPIRIANPQAIFFQAPVATNTNQGNLAEIGYFVQWDQTPGKVKPYLCRYYSDATKPSFLIYTSGTGSGLWLSGSGAPTTVAPANPDSKYSGWLADNVLAMWVRCVTGGTNNQPITKYMATTFTPVGSATLFPNKGYSFNSQLGFVDPNNANVGRPGPALPPCVEISLVVIDSSTARKITTLTLMPTLNTYGETDPSAFNSDKTTAGSVQYYMSRLPATIRAGAEVITTTVPLQNITP